MAKYKIIRQRACSLAKYEISDLVLVIIFCVAVSQSIDTFEWRIFAYRTVEECLELIAAAALMACSFKCRQVFCLNELIKMTTFKLPNFESLIIFACMSWQAELSSSTFERFSQYPFTRYLFSSG